MTDEQLLLLQISDKAQRHAVGVSSSPALARVVIATVGSDSNVRNVLFGPGVCLVTQGTKRFSFGEHQLIQMPGESVASLIELPATHCRFETAGNKPYVATGILLSIDILTELLANMGNEDLHEASPGFTAAASNLSLLEAWDRYLELLDFPEDIPALAEARERELLYRLLQSPHGILLRQFVRASQKHRGISRAIDMIRRNFYESIPIETLARLAGMSIPSFNRHFKAATSTSPLQYQKMLRLQAARQLLRNNPNVSSAAYTVGYASPSQFSREYTRYFGLSPKKDALEKQSVNQINGIF